MSALRASIYPRPRSDALIEPFAKLLAGLVEGDVLLADVDANASARVAAFARVAPLHRERAEAAELDPVAARQSLSDLLEDRTDDPLDVVLIEMRITFGQALD